MSTSTIEKARELAKQKKERAAAAKNPSNESNTQKPEIQAPAPNDVQCYYDQVKGGFWTRNGRDEWYQLSQANLKLHLRSHYYRLDRFHPNGLNQVEHKILDIAHNHGVHYAGPVAGFNAGVYQVGTDFVLVTRGPRVITPQKGECPIMKKLFKELFGEQWVYFYAWLKHARDSLLNGRPFRPGQALAIAGPTGSGKSLTQDIITEILGGRAACPYRAMMGRTEFNSDLIGSEHLKIEDKVAGKDQRSRLEFAAALKSFVANKTQSNHKKSVDANMLTPFWRMSITLNDQPENMLVLPSLTDDVADKIMLLKASVAEMPYGANDLVGYNKFWDDILAEIPAFLWNLDRWKIPKKMQCVRYGVKAWHHPDLVENIRALAPEQKLWEYISGSTSLFPGIVTLWEGTAAELKAKLMSSHPANDIERLLSWPTSTGVYLSRLSLQMPKKVIVLKKSGEVTRYKVMKE